MEPYEINLSEGERRSRRMLRRAQPYLRDAATEAGLFSGCHLPRCRRAKACLGRHPDPEIGSTHYKNFPPCVSSHALQKTMVCCGQRIEEKIKRRALEQGMSPEEFEQRADAFHAAIYDADEWPEDPLARVSGPLDRAKAPAQRRKRPKRPKGPSAAGRAG